jgi:hypothetical protein
MNLVKTLLAEWKAQASVRSFSCPFTACKKENNAARKNKNIYGQGIR